MTQPATHWRQILRARLLAARKERDPTRVSALLVRGQVDQRLTAADRMDTGGHGKRAASVLVDLLGDV